MIFYIDFENGNDAVRATLTTCIVSNPSGTTVNIYKVGHGRTTGEIATLSLFSSWLNFRWKITVVDADNFTLDDAVWQSTSDTNGTVTFNGGSSWADAWKTISSGSTSARVLTGDEVRIAKTPDPISVGSAVWTKLSSEIIFSSPRVKTLCNCESLWTPSTYVTASLNTYYRKMGTASNYINISSTFTTGKVAYYPFASSLDLSAFQELTFWLRPSALINNNVLKVCLCSDVLGDTIVDEFVIGPQQGTNYFRPVTLPKSGGGNLGSTVNSIAIYAISDPGSLTMYIDNFSASKTGDLNLTTLIGTNSLASGGASGFYAIQSINDDVVVLDNTTNTYITSAVLSRNLWAGDTGTYETFIRNAFATTQQSSSSYSYNIFNPQGSMIDYIQFRGGYNINTEEQDGQTIFDGTNGTGYCFYMSSKSYLKLERLSCVRYSTGWYINASHHICIKDAQVCNNITGVAYQMTIGCQYIEFDNLVSVSYNYKGFYSSDSELIHANNVEEIVGNVSVGISATDGALIVFDRIGNLSASSNGLLLDGSPSISNSKFNVVKSLGCQYVVYLQNAVKNKIKIDYAEIQAKGTLFRFDGASFNNVCEVTNVPYSDAYISRGTAGENFIINSSFSDTPFTYSSNVDEYHNPVVWFSGINGDPSLRYGYFWGAVAEWQTTEKYDQGSGAWKVVVTNSVKSFDTNPIYFKIANIACNQSKLVTVDVYVKKVWTDGSGTGQKAKLQIEENSLLGISETSVLIDSTLNGEWVKYTISFTPTNAGVAELFYYAGSSYPTDANYIGKVEISQAD